MAELDWEEHPERPGLRRAMRHRLRHFDSSIRVIAEGFLAEVSSIDLLAIGGEGEIISIRIGRSGDDHELLTRSLADLTWLRPRLNDFLKLAPGLGIEPSAEPRAMLLCPEFAKETLAAVENFPSQSIDLVTYHCFRQHGQLDVLLEARTPSPPRRDLGIATHQTRNPISSPAVARSKPQRPLADPPNSSGFRTGLHDADLHVETEKEKILD